MSQPHASRLFIAVHLVGCSLLWATSFLFMKLTQGEIEPIIVASLRAIIGALTLILIVGLVQGQSILPARAEWRDWLVLGSLNGWIPNLLAAYALSRLATGPAAMIQAASPLLTVLLAHLAFADERLTWQRGAGVVVGLVGTLMLIGPKMFDGGAEAPAALAMLALASCYAIANIYTRQIRAALPERLALGQQVVSALIATVIALVWVGAGAFMPALPHAGALLGLGVIATGLPILIFMRLIRGAGPTRASMTGYLVPVIAVAIGVVVLGEALTWNQLAGGLIVLAGVFIVTTAPRARSKGPS